MASRCAPGSCAQPSFSSVFAHALLDSLPAGVMCACYSGSTCGPGKTTARAARAPLAWTTTTGAGLSANAAFSAALSTRGSPSFSAFHQASALLSLLLRPRMREHFPARAGPI